MIAGTSINVTGRVTFLINQDYTVIEINDDTSGALVASLKLSPQQLSQALSRLVDTRCNLEIYTGAADKWGKTHEVQEFVFELPDDTPISDRKEIAKKIAKDTCSQGWKPDLEFSYQNSFFTKNKKDFARTIMRRWV